MLRGRREAAVSFAVILLLVVSTGIELLRGDVLWTSMGLWGIMVSLAPVTPRCA